MARSEETSRRINPRKCVVRSSCPSAGLRPKRTAGLARRWTSAGWTNKKNRESLFGERFDERRCIGVIYQGNSFSLSLFSLRYVSLSGSGFRWSLPERQSPTNVHVSESPSHFSSTWFVGWYERVGVDSGSLVSRLVSSFLFTLSTALPRFV